MTSHTHTTCLFMLFVVTQITSFKLYISENVWLYISACWDQTTILQSVRGWIMSFHRKKISWTVTDNAALCLEWCQFGQKSQETTHAQLSYLSHKMRYTSQFTINNKKFCSNKCILSDQQKIRVVLHAKESYSWWITVFSGV